MNLGEFRRLTAALPDDADLLGDCGDGETCETGDRPEILEPVAVLGHPHAVILRLGQPVYIQLDLDARRGI